MEEQFGVRENRFKLIYTADTHQWILYRNSEEGIPVDDQDRLKKELQKRLQTWMEMTERLKSTATAEVSAEESEELRSLGYVQ